MNRKRVSRKNSLAVPYNFTPAGKVASVHWLEKKPAYIARKRSKRTTGKKLAGLAYEKKVNKELGDRYGDTYVPGPWLSFTTESSNLLRYAQPDGLIVDLDTGRITICEIKLRHCVRAWWQLRQLYQPLVQHTFPSYQVGVVEIFRWFDATERFPEDFQQCETPTDGDFSRMRICKLLL